MAKEIELKEASRSKTAQTSVREATKSELTRLRILDAAARVFAKRGYAHTRLSDVAKEAQAHAGGIYYYFASREELVAEVLDVCTYRAMDKLTSALEVLPPETSTRDKLLAATTALLDGILGNDPYNLAHNKIHAQVPEEVQEKHQPVLRRYFSIWRALIAEGQARGEIHADIDPTVLRLTLVGSFQWSAEWASSANSPSDVLAEKMMRIFFHGMLVDHGDKAGAAGSADEGADRRPGRARSWQSKFSQRDSRRRRPKPAP